MANAQLEKLTSMAKGTAGALVAWFRRYRPWVYTGLTVLSILLIVWARFGFTLQFSRFYAVQCPEDADVEECVAGGDGSSTVQTREEIGGCGTAHPSLDCCLDEGNRSCSGGDVFQHYESGTNWAGCNGEVIEVCEFGCEGAPNAVCKAAPDTSGAETEGEPEDAAETESTTVAQAPSETESEQVFCTADVRQCADGSFVSRVPPGCAFAACPEDSPADELVCAPVTQTVAVEEEVSLTAAGGVGVAYSWDAPGGEPSSGTGESFGTAFDVPGTYAVTVTDIGGAGDEEAQPTTVCEVVVIDEEEVACTADVRQCADGTFVSRIPPTCQFEACPETGGIPTSQHVSGEIRNFSEDGIYMTSATVRPAQELQIRANLFSQGTFGEVRNARVHALLPDTVAYIPGTTLIEGQPTSVNSIVTGGLALGTFSGETHVSFRVRVKESGQLPSGTVTSQIVLSSEGDNVVRATDTVTFIIENGSAVTPVSQVQTGPGDVTLLALMAAALLTLLYVSYTYTHLYRSREVGSIARRKDPLNFR